MADFNSHFQYPYIRRRTQHHSYAGSAAGSDGGGIVHFASTDGGTQSESVHTDKAHEYDQALRQSRLAAVRRRGVTGTGAASVMGMSTLLANTPSVGASVYVDPSTVPSAVLGDSQGSVQLGAASRSKSGPADDVAPDGGVGSGLGESYVDGTNRYGGGREDEEEEGLDDGGVLGLLAQIYGRREGPPVL